MICRLLGRLARGAINSVPFIELGPRRIAQCGACYCGIYADQDYEHVLGEAMHTECVKYVRRAAA